MGRDKAWLDYCGKPLIQVGLEKISQLGVEEIFISGRPGQDYSRFGCRVLTDLEPGLGPMSGIERALREAASPLVLVMPVDVPQMTTEFLRMLACHCDRFTGAVPTHQGEMEPLVAIYPKRCHVYAVLSLAKADYAAHHFTAACLREHAVRLFGIRAEDAACLKNCNTLEDLEALDIAW